MKKILCVFLSALFVVSALSLHAFAQDGEVSAATVGRSEDGINMETGDTITLHYRDIGSKSNKPVPKGGHLEWYWGYYGGRITGSLSGDKTKCTVRGQGAGFLVLMCDVFDANGNCVSSDGEVIMVSSTFARVTYLLPIEAAVSWTRYTFWDIMTKLKLTPIHDIY